MSKKDFTGGLNSLLGEQGDRKKRGRPTTSTKIATKASGEGTREGETRATFIVREETLEKIKALAYWDRLKFKDVVNNALDEYLSKHKIEPRPEEIRRKEQQKTQETADSSGRNTVVPLPKY